MNYPKITIITPSFNQGHFIEETICSVLDQKYPNLDYIIIDGGSSDHTVDIIKKYENQLSYWISEPDKGQSDAINKGFKKASGEIINWLNSDDYYEPGALFKVAEAFSDKNINMYCGTSRVFGKGSDFFTKGTDIYAGNLEKTIGRARIDQPETFFRKSVWDTLGGVDTRFHFLMDKDFWIRYLLYFGMDGIKKDSNLLAHFRLHGASKTVSLQEKFQKEEANLFYAIALKNQLQKEADFMAATFNAENIDLNYNIRYGNIERIIHAYLFFKMEEAYAMNNTELFGKCKAIVKRTLLSDEDKKIYDKIKLRSALLPSFIKEWWNKNSEK